VKDCSEPGRESKVEKADDEERLRRQEEKGLVGYHLVMSVVSSNEATPGYFNALFPWKLVSPPRPRTRKVQRVTIVRPEKDPCLPAALNEVAREDWVLGARFLALGGGDGVGDGVGSQSAGQVARLGGLGLNVVGQVVGGVAREDAAAGDGLVRVLGREHHVDSGVVVGVDNGGDVIEVQSIPAVESDLHEHAGNIGLTGDDCVAVADPTHREADLDAVTAKNVNRRELIKTSIGREVNGAILVILGDEGN